MVSQLLGEPAQEAEPSARFCVKSVQFELLNHPAKVEAETMGWLRRKFFGRRVETRVGLPLPLSRVFSKNLRGNCPVVGRKLQKVA
jgi:hypothetical protein